MAISLPVLKTIYAFASIYLLVERPPVPDEQWLAPPLERDAFSLGDVSQFHLDLSQRQNVRAGAHRHDEMC